MTPIKIVNSDTKHNSESLISPLLQGVDIKFEDDVIWNFQSIFKEEANVNMTK